MTKKSIRLLQLYPRDMNIYGDWGNTLVLKRRLQWHDIDVQLLAYNPGDTFPSDINLIVGGGGQDSGQDVIQDDLIGIGDKLRAMADDDVPMLMICGLYQLFGKFFTTQDGHTINGIGLFDIETHAGPERLVGNCIIESQFGDLVGYENHSGQTFLHRNATPLGKVVKGAGNNGQDDTEGALYKNVIGTYLHGSVLPKNPHLADYLIEQAIIRKYGDFSPSVINDQFADKARAIAMKRPR